jgi:hypothetical protein
MASSPSSEPDTDGDKTIGFFSLPRELRDNIYHRIWQEQKQRVHVAEFLIRAAIPSVRLVSRQFRSEYDESSPPNSCVRTLNFDNGLCEETEFPRLASRCSRVEEVWIINGARRGHRRYGGCCLVVDVEWNLEDFLFLAGCSLPVLEDVLFRLYLEPSPCLRRIADELIEYPLASDLILNSVDSLGREESDKAYFAVWSREHGFLVDNMDLEKAKQEQGAADARNEQRLAERARMSEIESVEVEDGSDKDNSG